MVSKKDLWEAQLREWPESVEVTLNEMNEWTDKLQRTPKFVLTSNDNLWRRLAFCMYYPNGIFYRTSDRPNAHVGYRFGIQGNEYMSGWPLWNGEYGC
jgi:hypothetical protein